MSEIMEVNDVVVADGREENEVEKIDMTKGIPLPDEVMNCDGIIGEIMEWIKSKEHRTQPVLRFASALTAFSFVIGRLAYTVNGASPNLYTLGIAASATGKNVGLLAARRIANAVSDHKLRSGYQSDKALENAVMSRKRVLWACDEIWGVLQSANSKNAMSYKQGLIATLLSLYTSGMTEDWTPPGKADETKSVDDDDVVAFPHLSIYGVTTPRPLCDAVSQKDFDNGLLSRFSIFIGDSSQKQIVDFDANARKGRMVIPDALLKKLEWFKRWHADIESDKAAAIETSPDACELARDYVAELTAETDDPTLRTILDRQNENMMKYALIFACNRFVPAAGWEAGLSGYGLQTTDTAGSVLSSFGSAEFDDVPVSTPARPERRRGGGECFQPVRPSEPNPFFGLEIEAADMERAIALSRYQVSIFRAFVEEATESPVAREERAIDDKVMAALNAMVAKTGDKRVPRSRLLQNLWGISAKSLNDSLCRLEQKDKVGCVEMVEKSGRTKISIEIL